MKFITRVDNVVDVNGYNVMYQLVHGIVVKMFKDDKISGDQMCSALNDNIEKITNTVCTVLNNKYEVIPLYNSVINDTCKSIILEYFENGIAEDNNKCEKVI
jgi:hypothetical protein